MKYYIMHLPFEEGSKVLYLEHLGCIYGSGYTWTTNKKQAQHFSLEDALQIKKDFCAFKDSKENL